MFLKMKEQTSRGKMKAIHSVISGKIMKKYKCANYLSKLTGLCRHLLTKSDSKVHQVARRTHVQKVKIHKTFMKRKDNSRIQLGKLE